jgi:hypothetical protein
MNHLIIKAALLTLLPIFAFAQQQEETFRIPVTSVNDIKTLSPAAETLCKFDRDTKNLIGIHHVYLCMTSVPIELSTAVSSMKGILTFQGEAVSYSEDLTKVAELRNPHALMELETYIERLKAGCLGSNVFVTASAGSKIAIRPGPGDFVNESLCIISESSQRLVYKSVIVYKKSVAEVAQVKSEAVELAAAAERKASEIYGKAQASYDAFKAWKKATHRALKDALRFSIRPESPSTDPQALPSAQPKM